MINDIVVIHIFYKETIKKHGIQKSKFKQLPSGYIIMN